MATITAHVPRHLAGESEENRLVQWRESRYIKSNRVVTGNMQFDV